MELIYFLLNTPGIEVDGIDDEGHTALTCVSAEEYTN